MKFYSLHIWNQVCARGTSAWVQPTGFGSFLGQCPVTMKRLCDSRFSMIYFSHIRLAIQPRAPNSNPSLYPLSPNFVRLCSSNSDHCHYGACFSYASLCDRLPPNVVAYNSNHFFIQELLHLEDSAGQLFCSSYLCGCRLGGPLGPGHPWVDPSACCCFS